MDYPVSEPLEQAHRPKGALRVRPRTKGHFVQHANLVYAESDGIGLVMDVFEPVGPANGLGIVDVISGAWHSDRPRLNEHLGLGAIDAFCDAGFTVFAPAPGSANLYTAARMVAHTHAAIRHIKHTAGRWNVDGDRLGLCGVSAGGHIAALVALAPQAADEKARLPWYHCDTSVAAVGLFFPPSDLLDYRDGPFDFARQTGLPITRMLFEDGLNGRSPEEIAEAARTISPLHQVQSGHPPFWLAHATEDGIVPYDQSMRFADALAGAGVDTTFHTHEGPGHPWRTVDSECQTLAAWFTRHLSG